MPINTKTYEITKEKAAKGGIRFHGEFYRSQEVDKKIATFEAKVLRLKTKLENKKTTTELTVRQFREYLLAGGCASKNVRIYILNLIENFILHGSNKNEFNGND